MRRSPEPGSIGADQAWQRSFVPQLQGRCGGRLPWEVQVNCLKQVHAQVFTGRCACFSNMLHVPIEQR